MQKLIQGIHQFQEKNFRSLQLDFCKISSDEVFV